MGLTAEDSEVDLTHCLEMPSSLFTQENKGTTNPSIFDDKLKHWWKENVE